MEENTFTVEVPAGVEDGSTLRLADRGAAGQRGGPSGSLFVHLVVQPDPRFERQGDNLHTTLTISVAQAALGDRDRRGDAGRAAAPDDRARAPSTATSSGSAASACPTCAAAAGVTSSCTCWWRRPTDLSPEQDELLRQFAAVTRRGGLRPRVPGAARACSRACALPLASAGPDLRRHRRARRGGRPGLRRRPGPTGRSPTRTRTTWAGCCDCATARRSSPPTGADAGRVPRGGARRPSSGSRPARVSAATAPCSSRPAPSRRSPWPSRRSRGSGPNGSSRS